MLRSVPKEDKLAGDHEQSPMPYGLADNRSQYRKRCLTFMVLFSCLFFAPWAISQAASAPRILVLNSYHKGFPWTDNIVSGIESVLDRQKIGADLIVEYMDSKTVKYDTTYKTALYKLYLHKYSQQKFEVIISSDDNAFNFLREYHQELFPDTPIVFCGVNNLEAPNLINRDQFTGILEIAAEEETLDLALKLHPETKQVVVVTDTTPSGRYRWGQLQPVFSQYPDIIFTRIDDSSTLAEIEDRMKKLGDETIAIFTTLYRDKTGRYISLAEGTTRISEASRRPIYTFHAQVLQYGTVGGKLLAGQQHGEKSAEMAIRILQGEKVANIPIADHSIAQYTFDYQQLERFGIKSSDLPTESIIINIPFSFYKEYKATVWATIVVVLVLAIIIFILNLNIARRKRVEETLLESEARMRSVLETSPVGISIYDETGQCVVANDALAKMIGATKAQVLQQNYNELESWEISGTLAKAKSALQENITKSNDMIGKSTFGQTLHLDCYLVPFLSGRLLFMAHDITERLLAEEALRESETRVRTMFEEAPLGISLIDSLSGHIHEVNPRFAEIAGRSSEEMATIDWMSITHPDDVQEDLDNMTLLNAGKITGFKMNKRYIQPDGSEVWVNMTIAPMTVDDKTRPRHLCMIEDITERKQAEEELEKHREHLEEKVRERTAELQKTINLMAGREVRMTELKVQVKRLQDQLEEAGLQPKALQPSVGKK